MTAQEQEIIDRLAAEVLQQPDLLAVVAEAVRIRVLEEFPEEDADEQAR